MKGRRSMEQRHVKWYKVAKVSKKMNMHMFDGENIDLAQVIKDVNENFTLLFKSTISQYENLHRKFYIFYDPDLLRLRKALGFYIPFSRCMLKRCVEEGGVINRSLIDILNDIESHFVDLLKLCTSLLSQGQLYSENSELRRMSYYFGRDSEIVSRISNAYVAVFSTESSPQPTTGFMHSYASMVEFLDQVLEDLEECDMEDTNIKHSVEKSKFLREYIQFTNEYWMSGQSSNEFLNSVEAVAESAACYLFLKKHGKFSSVEQYLQIKNCLKSKMSVGVLKALVFMKFQDSAELPPLTDGLLKGYVDCVQENRTELINDELTTQVKNQFEDLHKDLEFLAGSILSHPAELEKLSDIRPRFQTLVGNVGSLVFSSLNEETRVKARTEMSIEISSLLEMADLPKGLIIHTLTDLLFITFGRIGGDSPQTNQLGFLNFLIDNLRDLKDSTFSFQTYEAGGFQTIHEGLVLLRSFLQKLTGNGNTTADDEESKDLSNRISCVAYEAEHLINSYVAKPIPDFCRFRWFSYFEQQVKLIKDTFADISEKKSANDIDNIDTNGVGSSKSPISLRSLALVLTSDVVVGFDAEMESIKERLVSDLRKLDVVSIVGMGGLGKTTLAKKVYEDLSIVDHFQFRAWCCVSQEYNKKELLLTLLGSIIEVTDLICRKSDGDLSVMLHKQLTGRRYLIVMDDIWGMDALKDLKRYFPDNSNGSRIMLTSRNRLEDYSDPLELRFLTDDESWDLLKHKVFQKEEECPLGLWQVGKKIAEKCRGLPLAIVVVSGILAKTEKKHDFWEQVSGNLSTYVAGDTEGQVIAALELSYKFLPDHLKPLFLYLGAFPEDKEIATNKLTWLWIADGFVKKTDNLLISLELQAELNLMDLIDRSLVMIARRSDGRVRSCSVHDMLRDLCQRKAKEENFMRQMNVHNELPDPLTYERRLSISVNRSYREHPLSPQRPFITCEGLPMLPLPHPFNIFFVL